MLDGVIERYLDELNEREFDAPFLSLLRSLGFYDIHFLHGAFEFGKDFIAKRNDEEGAPEQYLFQSKAGKIGLGEWLEARGQIEMLRENTLAHPNFDHRMRRRAVFVTTGRLVGAAPLEAQEYGRKLESVDEVSFQVWDREILLESLTQAMLMVSVPSLLLKLVGTKSTELDFATVERYSRNWMRSGGGKEGLSDILEVSLLAHHLREIGRLDLACYLCLAYLRGCLSTFHGRLPLKVAEKDVLDVGFALFGVYAEILWVEGQAAKVELDAVVNFPVPVTFTTYPVLCSRYCELLSIWSLSLVKDEPQRARSVADHLATFVRTNTGVAHPISDNYCSSFAAIAIALQYFGYFSEVEGLIREAAAWIADWHDESNSGLASPHSDAAEEVKYLVEAAFEDATLEKRNDSFLAAAVLDLCAVMERTDLYDLCRNEFLAVDIVLPVVEATEQNVYAVNATELSLEPNMLFSEYWNPVGWEQAPHHKREVMHYAESVSGPLAMLIISAVTRDRFFPAAWRRLLQANTVTA